MNPRNILRELARIYDLGKADERAYVRAEAFQVLNGDLVLKAVPFVGPTKRILDLLAEKGPLASSKEEGQPVTMLLYFATELQQLVEEHYISSCLARLAEILIPAESVASQPAEANVPHPTGTGISELTPPSQSSPEPDQFAAIHALTSYLLSTLVDYKASIESMFALYSEILVPRGARESSKFSRRLALVSTLLTQPAMEHRVVFALENVTSPENFPTEIGGIAFSTEPPFEADIGPAASRVQRYLLPSKRRLFAMVSIKSQDPRTAGAEAADVLNDVLNLVRFEYERERVSVPDAFAFVVTEKARRGPRLFSLPAAVPNPTISMDGDGLAAFVKSVDELVSRGRFVGEGRDRVKSAFRLYRTGLDTSVLENKLVNWWTAIEYLVRGSSNSGSIGKSVETMLAPVLCRSYLAKHLHAFRVALLDARAVILDPATSEPLALKGMSLDNVYQLFKQKAIQAQIDNSIGAHSFFQAQLTDFYGDIADPIRLHARNATHEQRLRWQLQRLWRARCDIVHSAERTVSAALLCANLEYYLKSTLMALLKALREVPTLSGPKEFFDRQAMSYEALQADLKAGSEQELIRCLSS